MTSLLLELEVRVVVVEDVGELELNASANKQMFGRST
jgi:hypothetical protein